MNRIAVTIGDPAGVGPELIARLAPYMDDENAYIIYGEEKIISEAFRLFNPSFNPNPVEDPDRVESPGIYVADLNICPISRPEPSLTSGKVAVAYLARATADAVRGKVKGILTMPINKFWAKRAGFAFSGQTEFLAQASSAKEFAIMMYSEEIKVVLLTTHLPLSEVPKEVKKDKILSKIRLIDREVKRLFGIKPRIGVLGLNPHAGEGGELGDEEVREIKPAIEEAKREGIAVEGPLVPDTAFLREDVDVFLCMYHDQGLIPFKLRAFNEGVNLTLGLPFPRTSPDHGTAYDIAWTGKADLTPSLKALDLLRKLLNRSKGVEDHDEGEGNKKHP